MDSNLKKYEIPYGTQAWFDFRQNGIGQSENAVLLNPPVSDYSNKTLIFYEKLGLVPVFKQDNAATFWGKQLEGQVAEKWQCWDGTEDGYIDNYNEGKIIRKCRKVNAFVVNEKYPWLFGSLDRLMNIKGGFRIDTGEKLTEECPVEVKTVLSMVAKQWENGIPAYNITQIQGYMLILGVKYSELAVLKDGRYLTVYPVEYSPIIGQQILDDTHDFWYNKVEKARPYAMKLRTYRANNDEKGIEDMEAMLHSLEPDPVPGDSYKQFLSDTFVKKREEIMGSKLLYLMAKNYKSVSEVIKFFEREKSLIQNEIGNMFKTEGTNRFTFGDQGHISYNKRAGGDTYVFDNRIKVVSNEGKMKQILGDLNVSFVEDAEPVIKTKKK